ncbi:MAG: hypothetical protein H0U44_09245, partial [Flavisolibacter sp.]|nr:hypothetical protein [Flavisolibacter sp.]
MKQGSRKKIFRISLLVAGTLVLIVIFLHLWFVNNARNVLKAYISEQSQGKIQLNLSELGLNLWTNRLNINEAVLVSTDSLTAPITYHVSFSKLSLKVGSIWALLFQKRLLLDSVKLYNPSISIYQWKKDTTKSLAREDLSIPQEMGKVYNSMQEALEEFGIRRIVIDNAQISLIDKIKNNPPVTVSGIFLDLARTLEEGKKHQFLKNEQTVELTLGQ